MFTKNIPPLNRSSSTTIGIPFSFLASMKGSSPVSSHLHSGPFPDDTKTVPFVLLLNPVRFNLLDFPEGMVVEGSSGTIRWTPTVAQADAHRITIVASDGYTKDERLYFHPDS